MKVEFIEPALIELDDAIEYYNFQSCGLGNKFFDEVLLNINWIQKFPDAWPKYSEHTYKINLKKFPYSLIFSKKRNSIYIIAVAHHHRKPEYWVNRRNK
jgi:hypothetical protein